MNKEIEQEIKKLMFKEIKKLKTYAINYHNYKKKIQFNDIDIQNINNSIEDKSKKSNINSIMKEHNYAKTLPIL